MYTVFLLYFFTVLSLAWTHFQRSAPSTIKNISNITSKCCMRCNFPYYKSLLFFEINFRVLASKLAVSYFFYVFFWSALNSNLRFHVA